MISIEAMVRVLVKKGLVTQQEILEEIKLVELAQESERELKKGSHALGREGRCKVAALIIKEPIMSSRIFPYKGGVTWHI